MVKRFTQEMKHHSTRDMLIYDINVLNLQSHIDVRLTIHRETTSKHTRIHQNELPIFNWQIDAIHAYAESDAHDEQTNLIGCVTWNHTMVMRSN